jgi:uncharacterized protein
MSERNGYQHGVPCWVDTWQPDAESAVDFYTQLFGWEAEETTPPDSSSRYFMCRLRGRDVAAVGSPSPPGAQPVWGTYVWVEDVDRTAAKAIDAGGSVVMEPFDSLDGGRMAVIADPAGAALGVWRPGAHKGAQLVNEPSAWSMSALNTRDLEGAERFYGAVLGWEADTFALGDAEVTLWRLPGFVGGEPGQPPPRDNVAVMLPMSDATPEEVAPHWSIDFWVDDVDQTAAKASELGGEVLVAPYELPGLRQAVVADPRGASFSVTKVTARG